MAVVVLGGANAMVTVPLMQLLRASMRSITGYSARVPTRRASLALLVLAALALPATSGAAKQRSIRDSKLLWSTVNVCDTAKHPDGIGVRASMPGSGVSAERMFIRLQVQYLSTIDGKWHNLGAGGDSGFIPLGSGRYKVRQSGRTFTIVPPASGSSTLRGAATFEWRRGGDVVRRVRETTAAGHPSTSGADPADYSAATCKVVS